jgi:hypothetical protein
MLDSEARRDIQTIREAAINVWGRNCEFEDIIIKDSPYPEFELPIRLYQCVKVGIYYDRSALDMGIMQEGKYILLEKFTTEMVHRGMKAMEFKNLFSNFKILDDVAKGLISTGQY